VNARTSVWEALARHLDAAGWRPQLGPWVEVKRFELPRGASHAIVGNPRDQAYFRLSPAEADLLERMDGTRTVGELVLDRFESASSIPASA
jgi:hypothetical protein